MPSVYSTYWPGIYHPAFIALIALVAIVPSASFAVAAFGSRSGIFRSYHAALSGFCAAMAYIVFSYYFVSPTVTLPKLFAGGVISWSDRTELFYSPDHRIVTLTATIIISLGITWLTHIVAEKMEKTPRFADGFGLESTLTIFGIYAAIALGAIVLFVLPLNSLLIE